MGASWQKNLEKKGAKYAQSLLDLRGNDFVICNDYGFPINPDSYAALVRRVGKKGGHRKNSPAYVPAHLRQYPAVQSQHRCGNGGRRSRTRATQHDPCNLYAGLRQAA